jgi:hypothetical protein
MRFIKILTNAAVSGLLFALLLALLLVDLNINRTITMGLIGRLSLHLLLIYGLPIAIIASIGFFIIQFFSGRRTELTWISPPFLYLGFSLFILLFLVILKANEDYFSSFFNPPIQAILKHQMIALLLPALLGLAVVAFLRRWRRRPLALGVYLIVIAAVLVFAFFERGRYPEPARPAGSSPLPGKKADKKITIIGLDGLSFDFITPLVSKGKLPNFSWLLHNGSSGRLISFSPNEPVTLNASFITGKYPAKHRQISAARYRLWGMNEELDIVPRFIFFNQLAKIGLLTISPSPPVSRVKDIWQVFEGNRISFLHKDWPYGRTTPAPNAGAEKLLINIFDNPGLLDDSDFLLARNAFFRDLSYEDEAAKERELRQPQVFAFILDGLNTVEAYYYKYSVPSQFGEIEQERIDRYGPVIEKYYEFYDELIGRYLTGLKDDELLVVYSPHGIEPLPLWKRFVERLLGDPNVSAYHELAPDGVVFFYGKGIARGKKEEAIRIVDITPTLLYYLGLPVGRDMDGIVRSSYFTEEFIAENPIIYISSYDDFQILPPRE